ncbi:hypothetical protein AB0M45_29785 [Nocardia sp. NPDC051787]|uniref:hypothetical protein n=1 Tax=Nocardia sp. NPDC051787 TaxID=3155415 RepID=UPI003429EDBB
MGDALARQLAPITDDLVHHVVPGCAHIIPLDAPTTVVPLLADFLAVEGLS